MNKLKLLYLAVKGEKLALERDDLDQAGLWCEMYEAINSATISDDRDYTSYVTSYISSYHRQFLSGDNAPGVVGPA